ncbi:RDD family protein [Actomonas aquatica]|uniref:RDD family protein n=1 Tax=Actomonas aquatica TaxID=2866162 RepID=A0ABZ1C8E8_9BACT|nr:RDD family protein [Opitutus sp. WL0086]WRQ86595.1 RDD family protein [Opitutus sp. WL0086]
MDWFYAINNNRQGPVNPETLARLVSDGTITAETLVWRQGMAKWEPYGEVAAAEGLDVPGQGVDPDSAICAVDGKRYPKREMVEYEGRWISAGNRDVFFQRLREGVPLDTGSIVPGPYGYANFGRRFVAKLLDGFIVYVLNTVLQMLTMPLFASSFMRDPEAIFTYSIIIQLIGIVVGLSYGILFIRKFDATPGKLALGLKVLRANGDKLSIGRIIGRYFSEWLSGLILAIGYLMAAWDDEQRTLHDRICDTRVIKARA